MTVWVPSTAHTAHNSQHKVAAARMGSELQHYLGSAVPKMHFKRFFLSLLPLTGSTATARRSVGRWEQRNQEGKRGEAAAEAQGGSSGSGSAGWLQGFMVEAMCKVPKRLKSSTLGGGRPSLIATRVASVIRQ